MTEYPILVERFRGKQSLVIICETCKTESDLDPDDLNQDGMWRCHCGGTAVFKYMEADRCPNCRKLGFWSDFPTNGCCSRVCMLQHEYAQTLQHG